MPLSKKRMRERKKADRLDVKPEVRLRSLEYARSYNQRRREKVRGSIYFILDKESNAIKIGIADNPSSRMIELQIGNPHKLELLKVIEGSTMEQEHNLQQRFATEKVNGEWFGLTGELKSYLFPASNLIAEEMSNPKKQPDALRAKLEAVGLQLDGNVLKRRGRVVKRLSDGQVEEMINPELDAEGNTIYRGY